MIELALGFLCMVIVALIIKMRKMDKRLDKAEDVVSQFKKFEKSVKYAVESRYDRLPSTKRESIFYRPSSKYLGFEFKLENILDQVVRVSDIPYDLDKVKEEQENIRMFTRGIDKQRDILNEVVDYVYGDKK